MKILHCCLAQFYVDNYSYQENILPRMHKLQGHNVAILASTETYLNNSRIGYIKPHSYFTSDGIPIIRLPYSRFLPHGLAVKLRIYEGVNEFITKFKPDIIFIHDCQFLSITVIRKYVELNRNVIVYVDGHADFINSARGWISKNILHRFIYRFCALNIEPYTKKFYGVLPARVDFFINMYKIPQEKVELLLLGADLTLIDLEQRDRIKERIRGSLCIRPTDFLIVTGGKLDRRKNIHLLMKAIIRLNLNNIKLLVFGTPNSDMNDEIEELSQSPHIINVGWADTKQTYEYMISSDLTFFPGTHSVLWEQAVGLGLPSVFKRWQGIQHVDIGGNCIFLESNSIDEMEELILRLVNDTDLLLKMRNVAISKGMDRFSYYEIAKRAIELI